ncbi:quinone-dependent dihydroorotate dehydrogenase [Anthocerotibacter panamensis]|uniref:quinone-dependent dihydroorotate dehydrogenase n=1 Tax=Anthocerotibacter panamensis TaxID=2857077 RepID=UPI001C403F4A|nr:quinone-dependent dihydroorotate dehydrogenase [Anthocerotibacter panamensis]
MGLYSQLVRPLLFATTDAEWAHGLSLDWVERLGSVPGLKNFMAQQCCWIDPRLETRQWGLSFANPLGLAAGLDKHGQGVGVWEALGFGWAEIGTVTRHPQPGNERPRLFRLPEDRAVINRMGFNNRGAEALALKLPNRTSKIPLGINLGKSKTTALQDAPEDYHFSFRTLYEYGDYFVVNVSSPNTPGLRELQKATFLTEILTTLQAANFKQKPILVKIAPDLEDAQLVEIAGVVQDLGLAGIIATNTTLARSSSLRGRHRGETGGLSGAPLASRANQVIHRLWQETGGQVPIVGVGGIMEAEDAWQKILHGASLLQLYTGWVYGGPLVVRRILTGLSARCDRLGLNHLSELVGQRRVD